MSKMVQIVTLLFVPISCLLATQAVPAAELTGSEIVQHCDHETNGGKDQQNILTVILRDVSGSEKKNVYRRYWKYYGGKEDGIEDKMVLFTEFPPDAKDTGFMRWGYVPGSDKNADQWIYLPALGTIKRVSVRDPGDSFLGSDLTYQDISARLVTQDEHVYLREETKGNDSYYVVESTPKEKDPLYGKVISWYLEAPDWKSCNKKRVEFYDTSGSLLKIETLNWQQVGDAWMWDEVAVDNVKTGHSSVFRVTDPQVNVGLKDRLFTERTLKRGIR